MKPRKHDLVVDQIAWILQQRGFQTEKVNLTRFKPDLIATRNGERWRIEYESLNPTITKLSYWQKDKEMFNLAKFILVIPDLLRYVDEVWVLGKDFFKGMFVMPIRLEKILGL